MSDESYSLLFCKTGIHEAFYKRLIPHLSMQGKIKIVSFEYNAGAPNYVNNFLNFRHPYLLSRGRETGLKIFFTYDDSSGIYNVLDKQYWIEKKSELQESYPDMAAIESIVCVRSIEDWLLEAYNSGQPVDNRFTDMKSLYTADGEVYISSSLRSTQRFISHIDIDKIMSMHEPELGCLVY